MRKNHIVVKKRKHFEGPSPKKKKLIKRETKVVSPRERKRMKKNKKCLDKEDVEY